MPCPRTPQLLKARNWATDNLRWPQLLCCVSKACFHGSIEEALAYSDLCWACGGVSPPAECYWYQGCKNEDKLGTPLCLLRLNFALIIIKKNPFNLTWLIRRWWPLDTPFFISQGDKSIITFLFLYTNADLFFFSFLKPLILLDFPT